MIPDRREVLRYLGMRKKDGTPVTDELIARCTEELNQCIQPASVYRFFDLSEEDGTMILAGYRMESRDLFRNLSGCRKAAVMACTLGIGADRLIRRAQLCRMSEAAVLQAVSAAMIEMYADEVNEEIRRKAREMSLYARPRYSPGYGDLSLETQKTVFALLNPEKHAGITLNRSLLMVPSKSITAVIGLSDEDAPCIRHHCDACSASETCPYADKEEDHAQAA